MSEPTTVPGVFTWIVSHPRQALLQRWNYKSALLSASIRAPLFFATNSRAGLSAALSAMLTEWVFRACTAGFYGALTQAFRRAEPKRAATLAVIFLLPAVSHGLELTVHWFRGTPELAFSISASILLTSVSTAFNLFAMREGALIVGEGKQSILADLRAIPHLIIVFVARSCRA